MTNAFKGAFNGVKILDFTQVIAGSYSTTILGDMGAEIVKVEPPGHGDPLRLSGPMHNNESGFFLLNNRNKKSVSVDLKSQEGVEVIKKMIPHFDVFIENYKPGVMEKFGLGYEDVKKLKDDIIYVSVSGYGHGNQYSSRPAYDNVIQSECGLAVLNGFPENDIPLRSPLSVSDYAAGLYGALGIMSALYHHKNTGEGQSIDVAMYDSLISIMDNSFLIYHLMQGQPLDQIGLKKTGNRHPGAAPHSFFRTKDGFVAHMSLTNAMWHKLLKIIGREELIGDERYESLDARKERWKEVDAMIEEWTTRFSSDEVIEIFSKNRLPCGKARSVEDVYHDPQTAERGIFHDVEHPVAGKIRITNVPIKASQTPPRIVTPSPKLGEHTSEIFSQYGDLSQEEIDDLLARGVLFRQEP